MSIENNALKPLLPPPIVLHRKGEKYVLLSDGDREHPVFIGGTFKSDSGEHMIEDINTGNGHIQIRGRWYYKGEFEPATVIRTKCRKSKGRLR